MKILTHAEGLFEVGDKVGYFDGFDPKSNCFPEKHIGEVIKVKNNHDGDHNFLVYVNFPDEPDFYDPKQLVKIV